MDRGYAVYEYSRRGLLNELQEELRHGNPPDEYLAYDGSTALVMAARCGHGPVVRELLAHGADAQLRTDEGSTLLHHAVSGGSEEATRALLAAGLDPNTANEDGVVPLILAAHYGRLCVVRLLCEGGADINLTADGWGNALDGAEGDVAEYLAQRGARRSAAGADQPVAAAAERFHYGCFESGENPRSEPEKAAPSAGAPSLLDGHGRPKPGDQVMLRRAKPGVLQEGDVGRVVTDDGSDCLPLKVACGDAYDYYDVADLVLVPPENPSPDCDRATPEGTQRILAAKLGHPDARSELGTTGLSISPVGFGCHRLEDRQEHKTALELAIKVGCNFVDLAPNYTNGVAEEVVGEVVEGLIQSRQVRREELVIATKVGNVLGKQLAHAEGVPGMTQINDSLYHCISPEWIEQELTRSLARLRLVAVDCLLLHCPEYETKAPGVDMDEVYRRLGEAFRYLEKEVQRGRIAMYGVSASFAPLRPTDPEHLVLAEVMAQLPENHHFRVLQFPLNFAEAEALWVGHTRRHPDGTAVDKDAALEADTLFESAKAHGLATLVNRPLDGIYKESHGVLRFSSLDSDVRSFSELQLDNCDVLEEKITGMCRLSEAPHSAGDGASQQLAAKTVKVLASLKGVDCVLLGMRRPEYVLGTLPLAFRSPPVAGELARGAVRAAHNTVAMWFATAIHEADHGTSKDWRLDISAKWTDSGALGS